MLACAPVLAAAQEAPALRTAASFAILGGAAVTNNGTSRVTGNVGGSSAAPVSGFPRGVLAVGDVHANDDLAHEAMGDVARIYGALDAQPCTATLTMPPGPPPQPLSVPPQRVYCLPAPLTGSLTLDGGGDPGSVWIFRADGDFTTAANSSVVLTNGAAREHVFWLTHGSATLGAHSILVGNVVASGITLGRGASLYGRAFARAGPITLDTDLVSFCCDTVTLSGSQSFTASGGTEPYTFEVFDGTLPSGVALHQTGRATAELTGAPAASYSVVIAATDLHGCTGIRTVSVTVCPTITLPPLDAPSCEGYGQTLVPNAGTPPFSFQSSNLPSGLSLSSAAGKLTGAPSVQPVPACETFTVTVTDANGCTGSRTYTVCTRPVFVLPPALVPAFYLQTIPISGTIVSICGTVPGLQTLPTPPGQLTISGTPSQNGVYTLTVTTVGADDVFTQQNLTLQVGLCPVITVPQPALPNGTVNVLYGAPLGSARIEPSNGTQPYTFASIADPPGVAPGVPLDSSGRAMGMPTTAGMFSYAVSGTDAQGCPFSATRSIVICPVITLVPASLPDATVGVSYGPVVVQALPAGSYSYALTSTPPGFGIDPQTGAISAMPSTPGQYQLTVTATDGNGCSGSETYTVNVLPYACLLFLSIAPSTLPNGTVGVLYTQPLTVIGGGTPPFTFLQPIGGSLPPGFALPASGVITGTAAVPGRYCFTVTARDANGCVAGPADYTILIDPVSCPGGAPITISPPGPPPAILNTPYAQVFTAAGGTPPYTFTASGLPPLLTLNPVTGLLSGTPTAVGIYPITITVTDANGCFATTACSLIMTVDIPALSAAALLLLAIALGAAGCIARRG